MVVPGSGGRTRLPHPGIPVTPAAATAGTGRTAGTRGTASPGSTSRLSSPDTGA